MRLEEKDTPPQPLQNVDRSIDESVINANYQSKVYNCFLPFALRYPPSSALHRDANEVVTTRQQIDKIIENAVAQLREKQALLECQVEALTKSTFGNQEVYEFDDLLRDSLPLPCSACKRSILTCSRLATTAIGSCT